MFSYEDFIKCIKDMKNVTEIKKSRKLSDKLIDCFPENIKLMFISLKQIIIITKDDKLYAIMIWDENTIPLLALSTDNSILKSIIQKLQIEELSDKRIENVVIGFGFFMSRTNDGHLYSCGLNNFGQLGIGCSDLNNNRPKLIEYLMDECIDDVKCGLNHTLVLTTNRNTKTNRVYAWGGNEFGQIGNGSNEDVFTPYHVDGFNGERVTAISCGANHSMVLTESGHVFSWGQNSSGQLGVGNNDDYYVPKLIDSNVLFTKISCGKEHTLLLTCDQDIYAFGNNSCGQVGEKSHKKSNYCSPVQINDESSCVTVKFTDIASHFYCNISAAKAVNGRYFFWGEIKCNRFEVEIIWAPLASKFMSFNDIFLTYSAITYEPLRDNFEFDDNFVCNGIYDEFFEELKYLGSGSYGDVYKVRSKLDKKVYAIKVSKHDVVTELMLRDDYKTSLIIKQLSHDCIVRYFDVWFQNMYTIENGRKVYHEKLKSYIQMEYCDKKLEDIIQEIHKDSNFNVNGALTLIGYYIASELFIEMLESVNYLHQKKLIHRDLNPRNILLAHILKGKFIKIADFGLVTLHDLSKPSHSMDKGSLEFMAPEVADNQNYTTKVDIYSLGVLSHKYLFDIDTKKNYSEDQNIPKPLRNRYQKLSQWCGRMIRNNPLERPTCEQILNEKKDWALSHDEFEFEEELKKISDLNEKFLESKKNIDCFYTYRVLLTKFHERVLLDKRFLIPISYRIDGQEKMFPFGPYCKTEWQ